MAVLAPYAKEHQDINGPGDARPSALKIIRDQGLDGKLAGKVFLITGCTSGIGLETARAIHVAGADVYITARDATKGEEAVKQLTFLNKPGKVEFVKLELDDLASVRQGAKDFLVRSGGKLNVLINNAGVMMTPEGTTKDGFETQFGTNHLGHFALFQALKDALLASSTPEFNSRVVTLSSAAHRWGDVRLDDYHFKKGDYDPRVSYGQSKTANLWMANEIDRRYGSRGLHAWAVHPGGINTNLGRHIGDGLDTMLKMPEIGAMWKDTPQGAATTVWAAVAKELEGRGGLYLEEVQESEYRAPSEGMDQSGYTDHSYNENGEKQLWKDSLQMIGETDDQ